VGTFRIRTNFIPDLIGLETTVELAPGENLADLVDALKSQYGGNVSERLLKDGQLRPNVIVLINGAAWRETDWTLPLPEGAEVSILQFHCGG
jgi:molybdopterin converting factor small subunit